MKASKRAADGVSIIEMMQRARVNWKTKDRTCTGRCDCNLWRRHILMIRPWKIITETKT